MFQSGKKLDTVFQTEAAFYRLETDGRVQTCRSRAAIHRMGTEKKEADALFVLLNPGKCLPLDGEESISLLFGKVEKLPLLPAAPDNTMYQLMRLMERMDWNHIQIINLTDLRTGKFDEYKESQKFMQTYHDNRHSIFSIDRYPELLDCLEQTDTVIAGWGTKSPIIPAAENAYNILMELEDVQGLPYSTYPLYYHPFPWLRSRCVKWLDEMEEQLKRVAEVV